MQPPVPTRRSRLHGFTLIEMMIVVVIGAILLSIAVPSYMTSIRKSRRADAKTAALELAGREERYLTTNPAGYSVTPADLGYTAFGLGNPIGTGQYYYVSAVCVTAPGAASACPPSTLAGPSFLVTVSADARNEPGGGRPVHLVLGRLRWQPVRHRHTAASHVLAAVEISIYFSAG